MNWIQTKTTLFRGFPPDGRYLIGVSGGRDSVALLHQLVDLGYKKLVVCHLNHRLRGRSSDADARFVEKLAAKYDVDLELGSANVRALAKKKKMSIETAARRSPLFLFRQSCQAPPMSHNFSRASRRRSRRNVSDQFIPRGRKHRTCRDARSFHTPHRRCRSYDCASAAWSLARMRSTNTSASIG